MLNNIAETLKQSADWFRVCCFSPTPSERKKLFERVREAGVHYKPILEEELGVEIGEVKPRPYLERPFWGTLELYQKAVKKSLSEINPNILGKAFFWTAHIPIHFLVGFPLLSIAHFVQQDRVYMASGSNGTVYVSEGLATRQGLFMERHYGKNFPVEEFVVHELAHEAWDKLGGEKKFEKLPLHEQMDLFSLRRTWQEGFCSYLQKDLVPWAISSELPELYKKGLEKVRKVIRENGRGYLRQLPLDWLMLEKAPVSI